MSEPIDEILSIKEYMTIRKRKALERQNKAKIKTKGLDPRLFYYLYARVSDSSYDDSVEQQEEMLIDLASKMGITKDHLIMKSDEKSGSKKDKNREGFEDMMKAFDDDMKEDPYKRKFGGIFFWKIDRLSRNSKDFARIDTIIDKWYKLISYTETIENTYTGRLLFRLLSSFAIYESEKLSARMTLTIIFNLVNEHFNKLWGGIMPFGYKFHNGKLKKIKKYEIVVQDIFRTFISEYNKLSVKPKKTFAPLFRTVADKIEKKHKWVLKKYAKIKYNNQIKKRKQKEAEPTKNVKLWKPYEIVANVLKNTTWKTSLKYIWVFESKITIKDDTIIKRINSILEENYDNFELVGDCSVGEDMLFSFPLWHLIMVADIQFEKVRQILQTNTKKKCSVIDGLFQWLVYLEHKNTYIKTRTEKRKSKGIDYYNYRSWAINKTELSRSEIKIEQALRNSGILKNIWTILSTTRKQTAIKGILKDRMNWNKNKKMRSYTINKTLLETAYKENEDRLHSTAIISDEEREAIEAENRVYSKQIAQLEMKRQDIKDFNNNIIKTVKEITQKNLYVNSKGKIKKWDRELKQLWYALFIDKIAIDPKSDKMSVFLDTDIAELLWMWTEINWVSVKLPK